jgi:polyphosphate glucokinase
VLDPTGHMLADRVRVPTPYPCPPEVFVRTLVELTAPLPAWDRVTVGMPGMLRSGRVVATPHYVTEAGPLTARREDLVQAWSGFDAAGALGAAFGGPILVVNDAEVQGAAVVGGQGLEVVVTLGTGVGCAVFSEGTVAPHLELSQHPFRKGETYDEHLGEQARIRVGAGKWNRRVRRMVETLRPVFCFDRLYVGGGGARYVRENLGPDVELVANTAGILGGARIWDGTLARPDTG